MGGRQRKALSSGITFPRHETGVPLPHPLNTYPRHFAQMLQAQRVQQHAAMMVAQQAALRRQQQQLLLGAGLTNPVAMQAAMQVVAPSKAQPPP